MRRFWIWWQRRDATTRLRGLILAGLLFGGILATGLGIWLTADWGGVWLNLGTELIGATLTFFLIDHLIGRREQQEAEERAVTLSKADLIARLGSSVPSFAVAAAEELRRHGWLMDGSLQGVNLMMANLPAAPLSTAQLPGANLSDANLQQADLGRANLCEAALDGANLQGAYLLAADLCSASFVGAKLGGADLREANLLRAELIITDLQRANLQRACLRQAVLSTTNLNGANLQQADLREAYGRAIDLRGADLRGAKLAGARFEAIQADAQTILPDGTPWSEERQFNDFTRNEDQAPNDSGTSPVDVSLLESLLGE